MPLTLLLLTLPLFRCLVPRLVPRIFRRAIELAVGLVPGPALGLARSAAVRHEPASRAYHECLPFLFIGPGLTMAALRQIRHLLLSRRHGSAVFCLVCFALL